MRPKSQSKSSRSGSTLILFTLMLPTLIIPLAGLGIDATMCYIVQAKLGSAVDGAALGAGRLLGSAADPAEIAGEFLNANFRTDGTAGFWGANTLTQTITYTPGITKTIAVNATVRVPLLFARVFGQSYAVVAAAGSAQRTDSRVEMIIDRSGSMNTSDGSGSTVIADVVNYAAGFTQRFTEGTDELGLVVFDGSGVVGYPSTGTWSSTINSLSTGGPNTTFFDGTTGDMVHQINRVTAGWGTGMADALSIAYIELQKAHMRDVQLGVDTRLNTIVLFTDGVPSAITLNINNPANAYADAAVKSSSNCTNRRTSPPAMIGNFAIPGPPFTTGSFNPYGIFQNASTDPDTTHTAQWWMSNPGSGDPSGTHTGDVENPNPITPFAGCTAMYGTSSGNYNLASGSDLNWIPNKDAYGNLMNTTGYTNSHITGGGSTTSAYNGTALNQNTWGQDYMWGLAMWNAVDNAAVAARTDANQPNRVGDTATMSIQIFTVGYTGNGGCDDGLLKRVANDKLASSYDASQPTGQYIQASNSTQLANAFNTIASEILRLSK